MVLKEYGCESLGEMKCLLVANIAKRTANTVENSNLLRSESIGIYARGH